MARFQVHLTKARPDDAVIHHKFQPKLRMSFEKCAELRNNVKLRERNWCADP